MSVCFIGSNRALEVPKGVRHLAFHNDNHLLPIPMNKNSLKVRSLRSDLALPWTKCNDIPPYCTKQMHLRPLHLDGSTFKKWPMSIEKLKHLRYLDFSSTHIKSLPESITSLQKLQTLNLRFCDYLCELPKGMKHMKVLINLDIRDCDSLTCIPAGIGQLTCLRKLCMFIVGKNVGQQIGELRRLNLEGKLTIKNLDNVKNLTDARSANLIWKKNLESLELIWQQGNGNNNSVENFEETLCGRQPHSNLKKLCIIGYEGSKFPNWMENLLLPNLVEISLTECNKCEHLPSLGKLKFVKVLHLCRMDAVKFIGSEVYGDGESAFPSLEGLILGSMANLEEWAMNLTLLESLNIHLLAGLKLLPDQFNNLSALKCLLLQQCYELASLPEGLLKLNTLERQRISECGLVSFPVNGFSGVASVRSLSIINCHKFTSLSEQVENLTALEDLVVSDCPQLNSLPESISYLTALRRLRIRNCEGLSSLPNEIGYLTSLLYFDLLTSL
ncbi:disease resistance protein RGA2 [Jatropha curcas]|uniref:disease resistance protein RGA2 n=1 Tax=Jatropha curcas TaxID=180498 RepID=UPI0005FB2A8C|nr:disease resistance protein RGA2 [Jatropha curcas]